MLLKLARLHVDLLLEVVAEGASHLHVHLLDLVVLAHLCGGKLTGARDLMDLLLSQSDVHVLWLEVSMDDLAHAMHVIEADKTLPGHLTHQR